MAGKDGAGRGGAGSTIRDFTGSNGMCDAQSIEREFAAKYSYGGGDHHLVRGNKGRLTSDEHPKGISIKSIKRTSS
ncbi:hypothetical protein ACIOZL_26455 [Streptomyces sp. NPDC087769]|uniref:hypothetical protein n=1 Tax=Streptomyces sp. NPDC087769 TaxID=3365802 RepID=UPI0037F8DE0F